MEQQINSFLFVLAVKEGEKFRFQLDIFLHLAEADACHLPLCIGYKPLTQLKWIIAKNQHDIAFVGIFRIDNGQAERIGVILDLGDGNVITGVAESGKRVVSLSSLSWKTSQSPSATTRIWAGGLYSNRIRPGLRI